MVRNTEQREKWEMFTEGLGIRGETRKNMENETKKYCWNWNMVRNTEKRAEWEMHTVGHGVLGKKLKIMENEKHAL